MITLTVYGNVCLVFLNEKAIILKKYSAHVNEQSFV